MKLRRIRYFGIAVLALGFAGVTSLHAENEVEFRAVTGIVRTPPPPRIEFRLQALKKGKPSEIVWDATARSKDSYHIWAKTKDNQNWHEIPFEVLQINLDEASVAYVELVTTAKIESDSSYKVTIDPNAKLRIVGMAEPITPKIDGYPIKGEDIKRDEAYLELRNLSPKIEILGGNGAGNGSFLFRFGLRNNETDPFAGELLAKGDFNFTSKDRDEYFDNLTGQVRGYYSSDWGDPRSSFCGYLQAGLHAKVETDQVFDNIDGSVGVNIHLRVKNPVTTALHSLLVPKINETGTAPLFVFGYEAVSHIEQDGTKNTGSQRLTADFYWSMPVARNIKVPSGWGTEVLFDTKMFEIDFLVDVQTVYDLDKSKFTNNSKLVLDFHAHSPDDKSPSFTLTYARGKASPTFEHFDAFLAGFKVPF
ncbi:MAG TPA: hypothetical protein VEX43_15485 [Chthoniobacterales bacterium]|nr:hypothetical protein [Chthoniobacterales bacterium]